MPLVSSAKSLWKKSIQSHSSNSSTPMPESVAQGYMDADSVSSQIVTVAIVGCGQRGKNYAVYALSEPTKCKVVAIAEPRPLTQKDFRKYSSDTIKTVGRRLADAVIIAVQDHMHLEVVLAFADQGYHILCEKPMATSLEDCLKMEAAIKDASIIFGMGHVLRYSPYTRALTEVVRSGELGRLINVVHVEPVGFYHFAHSYVRGSWAKEQDSCFSLMTKGCHDIDLLCHWLSPETPIRVSSFGSLQHFRKLSKPQEAGSATRCFDCNYQSECPYSAVKIYYDPVTHGETRWPVSTIVDGVPDIENVTTALKVGPYGRCVYECDNDVVNLEFSDGATASFTMIAFTSLICDRQTRLHFTHGEIVGDMDRFTVTNFKTGHSKRHIPKNEGGGHGGGDLGLISTFIEAVRTGRQELLGTDVSEVFRSHLTVFASEVSRREGRVVDCVEFERDVREKYGVGLQSTNGSG